MKSKISTVLKGALILTLFSGSPNIVPAEAMDETPFSVKTVTIDSELTNAFHTNARWCGADGACSVPLDQDTTVWLFGDTFIRTEKTSSTSQKSSTQKNKPSDFAFINNTVSVQKLSTGKMKFYWRNLHGSPAAIMSPKPIFRTYYWPGDGFVLDEKLFVVNKVIVPKAIKKAGDFGFDWRGDDILQISNAGAAPTEWQWKSVALPDRRGIGLMGTALLLKGDFAYFYVSLQKDARGVNVHPTGVARIHKRDLLAMDMTKFAFWNGKSWAPEISGSSVIIEDGTSEMTVTPMKGAPYLVATYMAPMSADICMRFAKSPEGPWSSPIKVYQALEHQTKVLERKVAVYSAKAHPELAVKDNEVVVSYCCNPGEMKHYLARPDMYYPRVIRVQLKD